MDGWASTGSLMMQYAPALCKRDAFQNRKSPRGEGRVTSNAQQVISHTMEGLWLGGLLQFLNGPALTHICPKHQILAILQDAPTDLGIRQSLAAIAKHISTLVQKHCISD